jgi:hypothetical protein
MNELDGNSIVAKLEFLNTLLFNYAKPMDR